RLNSRHGRWRRCAGCHCHRVPRRRHEEMLAVLSSILRPSRPRLLRSDFGLTLWRRCRLPYWRVAATHEAGKFGILQKHDCLCVDDFAAADHFESFAESWLKDLDVLAFVAAAASFVCLAARGIFCGKKVIFSEKHPGLI